MIYFLCVTALLCMLTLMIYNFIYQDLLVLLKICVENVLCLNPLKSYVLPISKASYPFKDLPSIFLNKTELKYVDKVKNLGFRTNSSLSCVDHINSVLSKIHCILRNLRITSSFVPMETRKRLVPIITYSVVVYSGLYSHSLHNLQIAHNNAVRCMCLASVSLVIFLILVSGYLTAA